MAISTVSLSTLPMEILLEIIQLTPQYSHPILARVCRRIHDLVIPRLYRAVYFSKQEYSLDRENYRQQLLRSEIFSLSLFGRTLQTSPSLSALIERASFEWVVDEEGPENEVMFQIPGLLPPSLEQLHLSSANHIPNSLDSILLVTSLDITSSHLQDFPHDRRVSRDRLFQIFSLPRLDRLSILWDDAEASMVFTSDFIHRDHTSSVTDLSFYGALPPRQNDLIEILSWPKKLKSLYLFMRCQNIEQSWNPEDSTVIHISTVVNALQTHSESLEELCLNGESIMYGDSADLRQFTALRRLDLPQGDQMFCYQPGGLSNSMMLPPGLEILRIKFLYRRAEISFLGRSQNPVEDQFCLWFCDIALNASQHPKLSKVILENVYGQSKRFNANFAFVAKAMLDIFEKAGIELVLSRDLSWA